MRVQSLIESVGVAEILITRVFSLEAVKISLVPRPQIYLVGGAAGHETIYVKMKWDIFRAISTLVGL